jgi:hypothetical protein
MTNTILSKRIRDVKPAATREMTRATSPRAPAARSSRSRRASRLRYARRVREGGKAAIDAGKTRYTDVPGTRELTAAIIRKFGAITAEITPPRSPSRPQAGVTTRHGPPWMKATGGGADAGVGVVHGHGELAGGTPVIVRCPAGQGFR